MALTTTPYDPMYEPTACTAAPRLGCEPKAPIDEQPLALVLDKTLSTICETNAVLLEVCNALACSGLLKEFPGELRAADSITATIYNSNDAAAAGLAAARVIRNVLIGGEF